jgi:hypothetical protein
MRTETPNGAVGFVQHPKYGLYWIRTNGTRYRVGKSIYPEKLHWYASLEAAFKSRGL